MGNGSDLLRYQIESLRKAADEGSPVTPLLCSLDDAGVRAIAEHLLSEEQPDAIRLPATLSRAELTGLIIDVFDHEALDHGDYRVIARHSALPDDDQAGDNGVYGHQPHYVIRNGARHTPLHHGPLMERRIQQEAYGWKNPRHIALEWGFHNQDRLLPHIINLREHKIAEKEQEFSRQPDPRTKAVEWVSKNYIDMQVMERMFFMLSPQAQLDLKSIAPAPTVHRLPMGNWESMAHAFNVQMQQKHFSMSSMQRLWLPAIRHEMEQIGQQHGQTAPQVKALIDTYCWGVRNPPHTSRSVLSISKDAKVIIARDVMIPDDVPHAPTHPDFHARLHTAAEHLHALCMSKNASKSYTRALHQQIIAPPGNQSPPRP